MISKLTLQSLILASKLMPEDPEPMPSEKPQEYPMPVKDLKLSRQQRRALDRQLKKRKKSTRQ